ncbi:sugar-binding domain-containing protein [Dysgonomonas sp. 511]|uniref:glycosyl hydrolase 2 galactose-binding domain-containing protein n=1 Tax=Dysgonomonas sp. 511 TaxID=2302930 RepID=UPI0013D70482|nr:sugar-binding domain-containing protein [Dysgonomonas sp. 511]NDV78721.1 glycoside hydrolase family 2 [Dysgonomonas sp. 511]
MYGRSAFVLITLLLVFSSCKDEDKALYKVIRLSSHWQVFPAASTSSAGNIIASDQFQITDQWYKASVPSTIMGTLVDNGRYKDILAGNNIHNADTSLFRQSWWYRTTFHQAPLREEQHAFLQLEGISYYANIWLNGTLIASRDSIFGAYRRFELDITPYIAKDNILAIEVFGAQPGDPNIGFADWNPRPCDENMGIFRPVSVIVTGDTKLSNTAIKTKVNTQTLGEAWLTIETEVENLSAQNSKGVLNGKIKPDISFSYPIQLSARERKKLTLTAKDIPELHITQPRIWWCNNLGKPELYDLELSFSKNDTLSWADTITFGIREIESHITESGHREFTLNGHTVLLKGAGWTDDIFLRDTPADNERQMQMIKDMNLNLIRFEGFWGTSSSIYDLCDRYGIMSIAGWCCQWEWDTYYGKPCNDQYGCIQTDEEIGLISRSFKDQVRWLRNHPSIIAWMPGSDMLPAPKLEERYLTFLEEEDNRPYIGAAKARASILSGATGTKMAGPYEYAGPNYWYTDKNHGGAFGFNTETGIGAQLPVIESLQKFIPANKLWPIGEEYNQHCTASAAGMNSLDVLTEVINSKYGEASSLEEYLQRADLINYDGTRAMFEAFRVNLSNSTGIIQWMLNSAWPSLYWQLYDYYKVPTSAYYGVKKANKPLQLIYNYGDNSIYAVNESLVNVENYKAHIRIYDIHSKLIDEHIVKVNLKDNTSAGILSLDPMRQNLFISMELQDISGKVIADNFYAISHIQDEYDWNATNWMRTPLIAYNDFKDLAALSAVRLEHAVQREEKRDITTFKVTLKNNSSSISFFNMLKIKNGHAELIPSAVWQDNYISIEPGQEKTIECTVKTDDVKDQSVFIELKGWNGQTYRFR